MSRSAIPTPARIPETRRLTEVLPTGPESGLEFARIVDLLLFHEARREGRTFNLFSDRAGDYGGMDSFADSGLRVASRIGYQYKYGLFRNKPLVDALLDRLQHHCIVLRLAGPSLLAPVPSPDSPAS